MGKVRVRKETGKLYLDFMYQGHRCREQTALSDTAANRKRVEALLQKVEAKILLGSFDYVEQFPGSRNLQKLKSKDERRGTADSVGGEGAAVNETPLFADFADQWLEETRVQWRKSHTRNVESILRSSLKPSFKEKQVSAVSYTHLTLPTIYSV